MPKLIQISDTHLSPVQGFFYENFRRVADAINAAQPDAVVSSGDLSINGPEEEDDLAFAKWCHDLIDAPVYALPGNHDVGEEPGGEHLNQPLTDERLAVYHALFGPCRWVTDLGTWRLVGLNSQVFNTGTGHEDEQWAWLEKALEHDGPIGVFQHKPLYIEKPGEYPLPKLTVSPAVHDRLHGTYQQAGVRFIGSGHIHMHRHIQVDGIDHFWCPSTAFRPFNAQTDLDTSLGYLEYDFDGDEVTMRFVIPDGLDQVTLADIKENGKYKFLKDVPPQPVPVDWR